MERLQLTCEVVTPLFCAGADQQMPEIRVPSIRGAMRFWFRALHGAVVGDDIKALQQRESAVFGATEQASKVKVRVHSSQLPIGQFDFRESLRYMGYGLAETRENPARRYIAPGAKFSLELLSLDTACLRQAAVALCLFLNLGGMGARSRRGWGSLCATTEAGADVLKFVLPLGSGHKDRLQSMLRLARHSVVAVDRTPTDQSAEIPSYPTLLPGYWRMKLVSVNEQRQPFRNWQEALNWAGQRLRRFREAPSGELHKTRDGRFSYKVGRDYGQMKGVFAQAPADHVGPLSLPIFGLPIQYRFQSEGNQQARVIAEHHDRRGSPLWVRAFKGASGVLLGFMLFKAQFLPDGELLKLEGPRRTLTASQPDYSLLEEFLDSLPGEEITL
ncbi:MAG: type III-B CRISPR module RAMP protein Cmr1 [Nitrospinae bacterium]|nr:type III-B CRISPR module RAMP protein Cmr1 [Nitrospinota bacterium]